MIEQFWGEIKYHEILSVVTQRRLSSKPAEFPTPASSRYAVAFAAALTAIAVRLLLSPVLGSNVPYITLFPAVMFSSWYGGLGPGLLTAISGATAALYLFIPPLYSLRLPALPDTVGLLLFLSISLAISWLNEALRRSRRETEEAETAAREDEARMRLALDRAQVAVWDWDIRHNQVVWRGPMKRLYGLTTDDPIMNYEDFLKTVHGEDRRLVAEAVQRTLLDGVDYSAEFRVVWPDGSVRWLAGRGGLFTDDHARPLRLVGINVDITEQKKIEAELLERTHLIESSHDAIITCDRDRKLLTWNRGAQEMYGWDLGEAKGRVIHELLQTVPEMRNRIDEILRRHGRWEGELQHTNKNGERHTVESRQIVLRSERFGEEMFLEINRDITDRKLDEARIQQLNQDLENRVKERTRELEEANLELEAFSYSVSHDLCAPLRSIDGFSRLLLEQQEAGMDKGQADRLQRIRNAAQRMGELIDDLLDLSRVARTPMRREVVGLSSIAQHIANELQRERPDRMVKWAIRKDLTAQGDPRLLRVAIENLLGNAWKFTSLKPEAFIEFSSVQEGGETVFFVRDNGAGFDMEYAGRLFGAFQRLHGRDEFEGTGIGLATVQRIIKRHGGRIWADAAVDRGATFYFTIGGRHKG